MVDDEITRAVELLRSSTAGERVDLPIGGTIVPVRFRHVRNGRSLVISFHGAVDRATRSVPVFPAFMRDLGGEVSQLSVSDPSMLKEGAFGLSWYAGHQGFPSQVILSLLFERIVEAFEFSRVVFLGSSGGGFASLFYSSLIPGSIAIAVAPQTSMHAYYAGHIKRYREGCWPSVASDEELSGVICTDLCERYARPMQNLVIYLQSAGDHFHFRTQLIPFLNAVSKTRTPGLVLNCGYWGILGHSGAILPEVYTPWLRAALLTSSIEPDEVLQMHYTLSRPDAGRGVKAVNTPDADPSNHGDDERLSDLLRDLTLGASAGTSDGR